MSPHSFPRRDDSQTTNEIIAIHIIAGSAIVIVFLFLLWLVRFYRSKADEKGIAERTAALFRVNGVVRPTMAETTPLSARTPSPSSQHGLTPSIDTPKQSITRGPSSHSLSDKAVASSHDQLESSPASSTSSLHRPLSNASSGLPRPRAMSISTSTGSRHNRSSSGFTAYAQYFFPPGLYPRPTSSISTFSSQVKPVCQLFKSALPDELSLARYGEYLTVLRSFNDGWCIVARDMTRSSRASPLSPRMASSGNNVDVGLVPAWVFVEPSRGITVTRPFRVESINALRPDQNQASVYARDTIISGSDSA